MLALDDPEGFFATASWRLGVIGLGYVGLPLLITGVERGLSGVGFDVSADRLAQLAAGRSPIDDVSDEALRSALSRGATITDDAKTLTAADAIVICVPSPLGRNRQPDLSFIEAAANTVAEVARPGQLISLESTSYPGTTEGFFLPAIARAGLELDRDVWLAFSPERVSPGGSLKTGDITKIVGGVTPRSGAVAAAAYRRLVPAVHVVSSARAAEMAKLLENTYRAVNIGLINEMAQLARALDIDIWEVIEAAATKPFGFQAFWPGPGVGGHCVPLDPQYLAWKARGTDFSTHFIDLAEQVNSQMPAYNAERIAELLKVAGVAIRGAEILAVGIAYKRDIADDRESASLQVIDELVRMGAVVSVLDPVVGSARIASLGFRSVDPGDDLSHFALAAILTDHTRIDYRSIASQVALVYDARGVFRRLGITQDNVTAL